MHPRARELIATLQLARHPEGGWYRETWRSSQQVRREPDGASRSALTTNTGASPSPGARGRSPPIGTPSR